MTPSQSILIRLVDPAGSPLKLSGVVADITFFTRGNVRYSFWLSPTNSDGEVRASYADTEAKRAANALQSLMDYNMPLAECDDLVRIGIPDMATLQRAHEIATRWAGRGTTPEYAESWLTANNGKINAEATLAELKDGETLIQVPCTVL